MKTRRRHATRLSVEPLEARMLLSNSPGQPPLDLVNCAVHSRDGSDFVFEDSDHDHDAIASDLRATDMPVWGFDGPAPLTTLSPLTSIPALNSLPGATASLYLDFNGHFEPVWSSFTNVTTPVYSIDGDYTTYSDEELAEIQSIWARVAEDFAPFNINVTTVEPAVLAAGMPIAAANGIALRVAIGGSTMDWFGGQGVTGVGNINAFTNANANVVYVFSNNGTTSPLGDTVSHEAGHGFGLQHQTGDDPADGHWSSIMAGEETASIWVNGINTLGQPQDDMAVIAGTLNGFGYRPDDHGNTTGSATPLSFDGATHAGAGLIGTNNDLDIWSFSVAAADSYRIVVTPATVGPNLDVVLELRDGLGALISSVSPAATLGAELALNLVPGSYFLSVAKTGTYGLVGTYAIAITSPPAGITVTGSEPLTVKETGTTAAFQIVLDAQPTADVAVPISSSNLAEGSISTGSLVFTPANWNVPQTVTVAGVADGIADGDVPFSILIGSITSGDPQYDGLDAPDLAAVNIDNRSSGFLIWADTQQSFIKRSKLDGSDVQTLVDLQAVYGPGSYSPRGMAVDQAGGKMYWTEGVGRIQRANLNGTNVETLVSGFTGNGLRGVALDAAAGKIYWTDAAARKIQRANLDGSGVQDLVTGASLSGVRDLAIDLEAGKMYWPDIEENNIRRANLDGSNIEVLWTGVEFDSPVAIDLDVAAGKMFWADTARDQIFRANLNGSNAEVVFDMATIADGSAITGLALDLPHGKMYWTDLQTDSFYRSNLDGTGAVTIASESAVGITIVTPAVSVLPVSGLATSESGGSAAFTITLTTPPNANVTIPIQSSNLLEGTVSTASVTFAPVNWNVPQTVTVTGVNDTVVDGNQPYSVLLGTTSSSDSDYAGVNPRDVSVINLDNDVLPTKFYVVNDASQNLTYEYTATGTLVESYGLNGGNTAPRGAASAAAGDKVWVVDDNRKVYVYNASGAQLGSWTAGTLASNAIVEGIATNGTDVWIVDAKSDKVFMYAGAATRLSGSQNAASSFNLNSGNASPKDIVAGGAALWVVNDSTTDKVFKYNLAGGMLGSWTIGSVNSNPTGLTIDPSNVSDIWIVDSGTDRVYQYVGAASRISGSQAAAASFALAAGNTNPQGIADPPPTTVLVQDNKWTPSSSGRTANIGDVIQREGAFASLLATTKPAKKSVVLAARDHMFATFAAKKLDVPQSRESCHESGTVEFVISSDEDSAVPTYDASDLALETTCALAF